MATSATRARTRSTRRALALGVKYPTKISSMGGHYLFDDDQETPNTQVATFEFDDGGKKKMLVFEVRHWISNNEAGIGERADAQAGAAAGPAADRSATSGTGRRATWRPAPADGGRSWARSRRPARSRKPAPASAASSTSSTSSAAASARISSSEIEEGAISTMLIHLANISYRTGRTLYFDPVSYTLQGRS